MIIFNGIETVTPMTIEDSTKTQLRYSSCVK